MINYYRLEGQTPVPSTVKEWSDNYPRQSDDVAHDLIGQTRISTVFLGINLNFGNQGSPHLFETMTFVKDVLTVECLRCSTWGQAQAQHARVVKRIRKEHNSLI